MHATNPASLVHKIPLENLKNSAGSVISRSDSSSEESLRGSRVLLSLGRSSSHELDKNTIQESIQKLVPIIRDFKNFPSQINETIRKLMQSEGYKNILIPLFMTRIKKKEMDENEWMKPLAPLYEKKHKLHKSDRSARKACKAEIKAEKAKIYEKTGRRQLPFEFTINSNENGKKYTIPEERWFTNILKRCPTSPSKNSPSFLGSLISSFSTQNPEKKQFLEKNDFEIISDYKECNHSLNGIFANMVTQEFLEELKELPQNKSQHSQDYAIDLNVTSEIFDILSLSAFLEANIKTCCKTLQIITDPLEKKEVHRLPLGKVELLQALTLIEICALRLNSQLGELFIDIGKKKVPLKESKKFKESIDSLNTSCLNEKINQLVSIFDSKKKINGFDCDRHMSNLIRLKMEGMQWSIALFENQDMRKPYLGGIQLRNWNRIFSFCPAKTLNSLRVVCKTFKKAIDSQESEFYTHKIALVKYQFKKWIQIDTEEIPDSKLFEVSKAYRASFDHLQCDLKIKSLFKETKWEGALFESTFSEFDASKDTFLSTNEPVVAGQDYLARKFLMISGYFEKPNVVVKQFFFQKYVNKETWSCNGYPIFEIPELIDEGSVKEPHYSELKTLCKNGSAEITQVNGSKLLFHLLGN